MERLKVIKPNFPICINCIVPKNVGNEYLTPLFQEFENVEAEAKCIWGDKTTAVEIKTNIPTEPWNPQSSRMALRVTCTDRCPLKRTRQ